MPVKQVIVIRKDLKMQKDEEIVQAAHASLGSFLKFFEKSQFRTLSNNQEEPSKLYTTYQVTFSNNSVLHTWLNGNFTKNVFYVNFEAELEELRNKCEKAEIPNALIVVSGLPKFHEILTATCLGIGPWKSEEIDKIIGNLTLY